LHEVREWDMGRAMVEKQHPVVLVVDDDPVVRFLAREVLAKHGFQVDEAANGLEALTAFDARRPDIALLDVIMPVMDGFSCCAHLRRRSGGEDVPILVVTGLDDHECIERAFELGATDFVTKPIRWGSLVHHIQYVLRASRAFQSLRISEIRNRAIVNAMPDTILRVGRDGGLLDSKFSRDLLFMKALHLDGASSLLELFPPEVGAKIQNAVETAIASGKVEICQAVLRPSGEAREYEARVVAGGDGEALVILRDLTDQKRLERELLKGHKLESIAVLAGGIAHDFNNLLTAILGNISLAAMSANEQDPRTKRLRDAEKACLRARNLTQQLLTFSKGGSPVKREVSIGALVTETVNFALTGSGVRCRYFIAETLWTAEVDEGQMSQVMSNLVINACQAMPQGGLLEIAAENVIVDHRQSLPLPEGRYVKISVQDHGAGISPEDLPKVFDPFFSTKPGGSGLGLATAFSIVKRHNGYIIIESEPEVGTRVDMYLPALGACVQTRHEDKNDLMAGQGRILVMDDEELIRDLFAELLTHLGYRVDLAEDGAETLDAYVRARDAGEAYDAVIMDLTIPGGMGGKEAVKELLKIDAGARAIVASGYSNDPVLADFRKYGFCARITKPCRLEELTAVLSRVIATEADGGRDAS